MPVHAKDVMAVLDLVDDRGQLAAHAAVEPCAVDHGDLVGAKPPQADLAAAQLVDGKVALEDEVTAILDLRDGVDA